MKKIIYTIILLLIISCQKDKDERVFKSSNERFQELNEKYINTLTYPKDGWIAEYRPNGNVGGFLILFKFDKEGKVKIASNYNDGANDNTITYRVDKRVNIQLTFESFSVLHQIYATNKNGIGGEYVFNIKEIKEDSIILQSATDDGYNGEVITEMVLKKARPSDWDLSSVIEMDKRLYNGYKTSKKFRKIYVEGTKIQKSYDYSDYSTRYLYRRVVIREFNDSSIVAKEYPVITTSTGFKFLEPLNIGDAEVMNFTYKKDKNCFVSLDGGQTTIVENIDLPAIVDEKAVESIKNFNYSVNFSDSFITDYYIPLLKLLPNMKEIQLYNKYVLNNGSKVSRVTIFENKNGNRTWSNAYMKKDFMTLPSHSDIISFTPTGKIYRSWKIIISEPAGKRMYDFFFNKSFLVTRLNKGFRLTDIENPEYWIDFH